VSSWLIARSAPRCRTDPRRHSCPRRRLDGSGASGALVGCQLGLHRSMLCRPLFSVGQRHRADHQLTCRNLLADVVELLPAGHGGSLSRCQPHVHRARIVQPVAARIGGTTDTPSRAACMPGAHWERRPDAVSRRAEHSENGAPPRPGANDGGGRESNPRTVPDAVPRRRSNPVWAFQGRMVDRIGLARRVRCVAGAGLARLMHAPVHTQGSG
jgi:hypothetical protein